MADLIQSPGIVTPQFSQRRDPRAELARMISAQGVRSLDSPTPNGMAALAKALTIGLGGFSEAYVDGERRADERADQETMRDAATAMRTGVKGWSDPDGNLQPIAEQKPGFDALAQVLSGNPRLAGQTLPLMINRANTLEEREIRANERKDDRQWQGEQFDANRTLQRDLSANQIAATEREGNATRGHAASQGEATRGHQTTLAREANTSAETRARIAAEEAAKRAQEQRDFLSGQYDKNRQNDVDVATIRTRAENDAAGVKDLLTPNVEGAMAVGVPLPDTNPYRGLDHKNQQMLSRKNREATSKVLEEGEAALKTIRETEEDVKRFLLLNEGTMTGGGYNIPGSQTVGGVFSSNLAEMSSITDRLTPKMREPGAGATSDFDAGMFRNALFGPTKDRVTNRNIATAMLAKNENQKAYQQFRRDYFDVNNHLEGAERAWRRYLEANPIFDPNAAQGSYTLNGKRQPYQTFFRNETAAAQKQPARRDAPPAAGAPSDWNDPDATGRATTPMSAAGGGRSAAVVDPAGIR